jgi:hypothetical protein
MSLSTELLGSQADIKPRGVEPCFIIAFKGHLPSYWMIINRQPSNVSKRLEIQFHIAPLTTLVSKVEHVMQMLSKPKVAPKFQHKEISVFCEVIASVCLGLSPDNFVISVSNPRDNT